MGQDYIHIAFSSCRLGLVSSLKQVEVPKAVVRMFAQYGRGWSRRHMELTLEK